MVEIEVQDELLNWKQSVRLPARAHPMQFASADCSLLLPLDVDIAMAAASRRDDGHSKQQ